jgi:hypothetical protein
MVGDGTRRGGRQPITSLKKYLNENASALAKIPNTVNDFVNQQVHPKLNGIPFFKLVTLVKCSICKDDNAFHNGSVVSSELTGVSFLQLTCKTCSNKWFVDPNNCARRKTYKQCNGMCNKFESKEKNKVGHQEKPQANDSPTNLVHLGGEMQGSFDVEDEKEEGRTRTDVDTQQGPVKRLRGEDNGSSGNFISQEVVEQFLTKQFLCDKSLWGNESSRLSSGDYFCATLTGNEAEGSKLIVERAFPCSDADENDVEYHLLGAQLFNSLPRKKQGMMLGYVNETLKRMKRTDFRAPYVSTLSEVRSKYTEGANSIMQNLPLPCPHKVEGSGYSVVPLGNSLNYLMGKGYQLRTLRLDRNEDWFNDDGMYHNEFLQEVHQHLIAQPEGKVPSDVRVIFVIGWSDGFEKNILVKTKDSSLQLFTVWFLPEYGHSMSLSTLHHMQLGTKMRTMKPFWVCCCLSLLICKR